MSLLGRHRFEVGVALALIATAGCILWSVGAEAPAPRAVVATLGGQPIREGDFRNYLKATRSPQEIQRLESDPAERSTTLQGFLDMRAAAAKARKEGVDQGTRFKKAVELMELKLLAQLITNRHRDRIFQDSEVSPDEVRAYYDQHQSQFLEEPRFTAHHLVVYVKGNPAFPGKGLSDIDAREKATDALTKLRAGMNWDEVVATHSDEVTKGRGGFIREGTFGYFAKEVEQAVRTQELGKPGEVLRSVLGYHVVQVEERFTGSEVQPFEKVKLLCARRLSRDRAHNARLAFLRPIRQEVGVTLLEAGKRDVPLMDENKLKRGEVLARVGGRDVLESDFRWFLEDALPAGQRMSVYSRPGARPGMLSSFLDMLVLETQARRKGLDQTPEYLHRRAVMEERLLSEFMQERDKVSPRYQQGRSDEEQKRVRREYFDRVRSQVRLVIPPPTHD